MDSIATERDISGPHYGRGVHLDESSPAAPLLLGTHEVPRVEPPRAGIDYLGISVPVRGREVDLLLWDKIAGEKLETWVSIGATKVGLWCAKAPDGRLWAGASFNPARILSEDPLFLCSIGDLPIALDHVWQQLTRRARPADPDLRNASVRRVDLAKDFIVDDPVRVLEALFHIPRKLAKQVYAHQDPVTTVMNSITMRTSGAGRVGGNRTGQKVHIYDKGAQLERPDLNRLRWEARCQDWAKSIGNILFVHQLTAETAAELLLERWEWSGAGAVMASEATIVHAAIAMGLSPTATRLLIGDAVIRGTGQEVLIAKGTRLKRNARLRQLDHVLSVDNPYPFGSRLELESGFEVPVTESGNPTNHGGEVQICPGDDPEAFAR